METVEIALDTRELLRLAKAGSTGDPEFGAVLERYGVAADSEAAELFESLATAAVAFAKPSLDYLFTEQVEEYIRAVGGWGRPKKL